MLPFLHSSLQPLGSARIRMGVIQTQVALSCHEQKSPNFISTDDLAVRRLVVRRKLDLLRFVCWRRSRRRPMIRVINQRHLSAVIGGSW